MNRIHMSILLLVLSIMNIASIVYNPWKDTAKKCTDGLELCTSYHRKCVDEYVKLADKYLMNDIEEIDYSSEVCSEPNNIAIGMDYLNDITIGDYSMCLGYTDSEDCIQEENETCYCP